MWENFLQRFCVVVVVDFLSHDSIIESKLSSTHMFLCFFFIFNSEEQPSFSYKMKEKHDLFPSGFLK